MKIASRYLIPLEIYLASTILAWGLSGWFGQGSLWSALERSGQNFEWGAVMVTIGTLQVTASATEWLIGKGWCNRLLLVNVSTRAVASALATIVWFYACYKLVTLDGMEVVVALWAQAPLGAVFSAWCFVGNMRVRTVLHPEIPTRDFERTIVVERRRLIR